MESLLFSLLADNTNSVCQVDGEWGCMDLGGFGCVKNDIYMELEEITRL